MNAAVAEDACAGPAVAFWPSLWGDIVAHVPAEQRPVNRASWTWVALRIVVRSSGFHLGLLYRVSHAARRRFGLLGRVAAGSCFWLARHWYGCAIAPSAAIGGGLILPHPVGIVIGPNVELGPRAWVFQHVTIGGAPGRPGMPRIGADARLFTGAVIAGPIVIGDAVNVGANAVVSDDVPSGCAVRSPRAQLVSPERAPITSPASGIAAAEAALNSVAHD